MKFVYLLLTSGLAFLNNCFSQNNPTYKPFAVELRLGAGFEQKGPSGGIFEFNPTFTFGERYRVRVQYGYAIFDENVVKFTH